MGYALHHSCRFRFCEKSAVCIQQASVTEEQWMSIWIRSNSLSTYHAPSFSYTAHALTVQSEFLLLPVLCTVLAGRGTSWPDPPKRIHLTPWILLIMYRAVGNWHYTWLPSLRIYRCFQGNPWLLQSDFSVLFLFPVSCGFFRHLMSEVSDAIYTFIHSVSWDFVPCSSLWQ